MQPGLRRLALGSSQFTPIVPGSPHQREKLAVLSAFAHQALLASTGFDAAPALHALLSHAAAEHPQALAWNGWRAEALQLGTAVEGGRVEQTAPGKFGLGDEVARCLHGLPEAWRLAGLASLTFVEDFAIVDARDGTVRWLAVALPGHWAPEAKVGRHFARVRAQGDDNTLRLEATDSPLHLVTGPERWERFVWAITDHPRLHAHPDRVAYPRWADTPIARAWWRCERQTFLPLPALRQAVLTIAVDVQPLAHAVAAPQRAARLRDAVASMGTAALEDHGLAVVREPLLAWLDERAAPEPP